MSGTRISSAIWVVGVLLLISGILLFHGGGWDNRTLPIAMIASGAIMAIVAAVLDMRRTMEWPAIILRASIYSAITIIAVVVLNVIGH